MKKFLPFSKIIIIVFVLSTGFVFTNKSYGQVPILNYPMESPSSRTTLQLTPDFDVNNSPLTQTTLTRVGNTTTISNIAGAGLQTLTSPAHGNGGAAVGLALTSINWPTVTTDPKTAATDYYQFSSSTAGFAGITLQFDTRGSNSNAPKIGVIYNAGSGWIYLMSQSVSLSTSWQTISVALPADANNVSSVAVRIYGYGAGGSGAGFLLDNLQLLANVDIGTNTLPDFGAIYTDMNSGSTGGIYSYPNFTVGSGTSTGVVTMGSNMALTTAMVVSSGTFNFGTSASPKYLSGAAIFSVNSGATLGITDAGGITLSAATGNIQSTGTRTFAGSANYIYAGSLAQVTGNGLPSTLTGNLTINNATGVSLSQSTINTAGTISLVNGKLSLSTFNLTAASNNISGVFGSQYIQTNSTGQLNINVGNSNVFFPVGNSTYDPITLINSGTADIYGINVLDGTFATPYDASRVLNRRWQVSKSSSTAAGIITATAQFNSTDAAGSNFATSIPGVTYIGFYNNSSWIQNASTTGTGTVSGSASWSGGTFGLANLSTGTQYFALGKDNALINLTPAVTTSAITNITATGATSGGSSVSQGAAGITSKGVVWNTTNNPTLPGAGSTNDGTGTTAYTSTIISLSSQTQYYVSAYATNSYGTGYGSPISFYTLSSQPTAAASGFSATASNGQAVLNWTGATFPATGATKAGYLVVYLSGNSAPTLVASPNGLVPASAVSTGTIFTPTSTSLPTLPSTTATVTGLTPGTVYQFLLIPYTWDGTHTSTYNYGTPTPLALTTCSTVPPAVPGGLSLGTPSGSSITGTTSAVGSGTASGYTIFYGTSNTAPVPVNGNSYNLGGSPYSIGGNTYYAINQSTDGSFTATGLMSNTTYYFFVYSYSATTCGSVTPIYSTANVSGNAGISATVFYSASTGNLNKLNNWFSNPNGTTGTNPANFTTPGITYNIINNNTTAFNISVTGWTVQGAGSVVNIGDGSSNTPTLTIDGAKVLKVNSGAVLNVLAGSSLILSTTGALADITTGTLAPTSTVNFASSAAQTIPPLNFGNLTSSGGGARTLFPSGIIGIAGTFTPGSNSYTISGSTVNFNGTGQTIPAFNYYNLSNTNDITLAGSGNIGVEGNFTTAGNYTLAGSTIVFNGQLNDPSQKIPLISSVDLGSGITAGGYNNIIISSADSVFMPYTTGSSALGNVLSIFGSLTCSGSGSVIFNNAVTSGNTNTFYIGNFISTASSGVIDFGSIAGAGTSNLNIYGNFLADGGTLATTGTGNNAIVNFNGTTANPQQFSCASARQVWFYINTGALVNLAGNVVMGSASAPYPAYLIVYSGATLNCGTYIVTSQDASRLKNAYFILQSGATLGIGSPYGITTSVPVGAVNAGNIQLLSDSTTTLYRSFSSGANYVYNGTASQVTGVFATTPSANTIKNLYVENAGGVTLSQATTVSSNVYIGYADASTANITAINNSIFIDGGKQLTCSGTLNLGTVPYVPLSTITNASQFILGSSTAGTAFPTFTSTKIGAGTTVGYVSGVAQTVSGTPQYYNLSIIGAGLKTLNNNVTALGNISIGTGSALDVKAGSNFGITVGGSWTNAGTFTARTGTVTFNGGATNTQIENTTQLINAGISPFNTVVHNNSYTVKLSTSPMATGGTFTNSAGTFDANGLAHTVTGLATVSGGSYLAGTGTQSFGTASANGLTISGGTFTGSTGIVNVSNMTLGSGTLTAPLSEGAFNVTGNWTVNGGTFAPVDGTVSFVGTSAQAITGTAASQIFNNVQIGTSSVAPIVSINGVADLTLAKITLAKGSLNGGSGNINVTGASGWINNVSANAFNGQTGAVNFSGSIPQTIGGGSFSTTFNNLGINNSYVISGTATAGAVTLSGSHFVSGSLNMQNGVLNTSTANPLTINSTGITSTTYPGSQASFVNGPLIKNGFSSSAAYVFPVGKVHQGSYSSFFTGMAAATLKPSTVASVADVFTVEYFHPTGGADNLGWIAPSEFTAGVKRVSSCDYWTINSSNGATSSANMDVSLAWDNSVNQCNGKLYVTNPASLIIEHFNNHPEVALNYNFWDNHCTNCAVSGTTAAGTITWPGINTFSPFSLGSTAIDQNPLPVVLVNFNAVLNTDKTVGLTWTTEQEVNTSHFEVERSADGISWTKIGTVLAAGNSSLPSSYNFTDASPLKANYYRIKMVNIAGDYGYTEVREINILQAKGIVVFPNPARNYVNISVTQAAVDLNVKLMDPLGRILQVSQVKAGTSSMITLDLHNYAQGTYLVQVAGSDGTQQTTKVVIMR